MLKLHDQRPVVLIDGHLLSQSVSILLGSQLFLRLFIPGNFGIGGDTHSRGGDDPCVHAPVDRLLPTVGTGEREGVGGKCIMAIITCADHCVSVLSV